jgi:hypothetical protein
MGSRTAALLTLITTLLAPGALYADDEAGEDMGMGPVAGTSGAGGWPIGVVVANTNGDSNFWMWWARDEAEDRIRLQAWQIDGGFWGPSPHLDVDQPELPRPGGDDKSIDEDADADSEDQPDTGSDAFVVAPRFVMRGDRSRGERFVFGGFGDVQWNFAGHAAIPVERFYVGPLVGLGLQVAYPHKDADDTRGSGAVLLDGGFAIGGCIARTLHLRSVARVAWDPFLRDRFDGEGGALLGLDLRRAGAPVGIQLQGVAVQSLGEDWLPGWRTSLAVMHIPD